MLEDVGSLYSADLIEGGFLEEEIRCNKRTLSRTKQDFTPSDGFRGPGHRTSGGGGPTERGNANPSRQSSPKSLRLSTCEGPLRKKEEKRGKTCPSGTKKEQVPSVKRRVGQQDYLSLPSKKGRLPQREGLKRLRSRATLPERKGEERTCSSYLRKKKKA